jgi:hypothetical protein
MNNIPGQILYTVVEWTASTLRWELDGEEFKEYPYQMDLHKESWEVNTNMEYCNDINELLTPILQ